MKGNERGQQIAVTVTKNRDSNIQKDNPVTVTAIKKSINMEKYKRYLTDAKCVASTVSTYGQDMMTGFSSFQRIRQEDRAITYYLIRYSVELNIYRTAISCIRAAFPAAPDGAIEKFHDAYRTWLSRRRVAEEKEEREAEGSQKPIAAESDELSEAVELIIRAINLRKISALSLARLRKAVLSVDGPKGKKESTDNSGQLENQGELPL